MSDDVSYSKASIGSDGANRWQAWQSTSSAHKPLHKQLHKAVVKRGEEYVAPVEDVEGKARGKYVNFKIDRSKVEKKKGYDSDDGGSNLNPPDDDTPHCPPPAPAPPNDDQATFLYSEINDSPMEGYVWDKRGDDVGYFLIESNDAGTNNATTEDASVLQTNDASQSEGASKNKKKRKKLAAPPIVQAAAGVPPSSAPKKKKKKKGGLDPAATLAAIDASQGSTDLTRALKAREKKLSAAADKRDLAAGGWLLTSDERTGKSYYYKPSTGETTWEHPLWCKVENGDKPYWYHRKDGRTTWDDPTGASSS